MSTNQEIFNQFNSGFFHSIEELIQAHNDIHNNVIFNNDSIDDKITYQNMKNLIDNFKNRQYCRTCEEYYCLSDELPHDNTTNHIHNLTQSLNNEEILNYFQAGVYNTEEEIEFALTRINERIIFENDVINDLETFRNLKARLDILKGRRYCTYCETFYSIDEAMPHENTNEHRHYVTVQLGRGFNQIQSAIRSRLKTFWITPEQNSSIDVISFLNDIKQKLFEKLNEGVIENNSIKFNLVLICKFRKNEKEELDTAFKTPNTRVLLIDMIDEIIDEAFSKILKEKSEFQAKGSGWSLSEVIGLELRINKYNPLRGSTYIELPAKIKNTKSVVNVKNNDRYCFKYAIWSKNIIDHPNLVWNYNNNEFRNAYNWDCIKYPVDPKDIIKFERMNNISINLFGLDEKNNVYPMKIVDEELDDHRDLLYITNDKTGHYCWVKNFNKLIKSQITKHHHSISICKRCFIHFRDMTKFMEHKALCKGTGVPSKVIMPDEENKILKFTNLNRFFRIPYVIYADFECLLKDVSTCNPSPKESFTNVIQTHEPFSFCYMLVTPDGCQKPILYRGPNAARVFINRIKDEAVKIYEIYKNTIPINPLTEEEESIFLTSVNCHICEKELGKDRVKDHDHLTGRYRGPAHKLCNLKYKMPDFLPIFIHNLSAYDGHFIVRELAYDEREIFVIPSTEEKYISFAKKIEKKFKIRFVDTFRFMSASLATLVSNLRKFKFTNEIFGDLAHIITRKGVYPYDYTNCVERLDDCFLPSKEKFYNRLTDECISDDDYTHALNVWSSFKCKTLGDYSDVYLKSDVTLLADVFENFRNICIGTYKLDPSWYYTTPGLSFDAMLKYTDIELELLTDYDMLLMIEKGIRGGISQCSKRYCEANNRYMTNFKSDCESNYLIYLDANNLYGWALSRPLPHSKFRWLTDKEINNLIVKNIPDDSQVGYILEVDLSYPDSLHDNHNDLPLCPENKIPPGGKHKKLLTTLENKTKYIIHYVNLKQALSLGMKLLKVHRVIEFNQSPWLKSYIDLNTEKRKSASNDFDRDFYKLLSNAIYGKMMEDVRKRIRLELVTSEKRLDKLISKSEFLDRTIFSKSLAAVHLRRTSIKMNKPISTGFSVLELSKTLMYNFHYHEMLPKYDKNIKLSYMDTDSFIYEIKTDDVYKNILENLESFDTSNYSKDHPCYSIINKKVLGKFKDECDGNIMTHFIGLRSKLYSFKVDGSKEKKKAKGITKCVINKCLSFNDYSKCLYENLTEFRKMNVIRSRKHKIFTLEMNKVALNPFDDKRYICEDGINTLAWGHYRIPQKRTHDEAFGNT
ncbi:uncharacterized protein LOC124165964 [Ischnura elegans]|uniref:uncharacterized protein LOC124165964 n=1 Tax=Ischnura elegans TaxID=197161 RepID=UPI001ED8B426|nr:uncharacterized protein LOC124165964 [Ischnura elegans]